MNLAVRFIACLLVVLFGASAMADSAAATAAFERGDFDSALRLLPDAGTDSRASAIRAQVYLARGQLTEAEKEAQEIAAGDPLRHRVDWYLARAQGHSERIRQSAEALCRSGDPTGHSCVDAEFYHHERLPHRVELDGGVELRMAAEAPFPVILGETTAGKTGLIVDTGASESVITRAYARRLGLKVTERAFPVGVAGGGAQVFAQHAMLESLRLGGVHIRNLPVLVVNAPALDQQELPIILSPQQAFAGLVVSFDFGRHRLGLARRDLQLADGEVATFEYVTAGLDLAVPARFGEGPTGLFGLDTGQSGACVLSTDYYAGQLSDSGVLLHGAGASFVAPVAPAKPLQVGGLVLRPTPCALSPMVKSGIQLAGLLGNELWGGGVLVLDTIKRRVSLRLAKS